METISGAKGRRRRYSDEMRQDILQAARAIIAEEGAGALSIRGIARRIDYSAPALYEYFDGKEAIAAALFRSGFEQLAEVMEHIENTEPDAAARIRAMAVAYRQFALTHPQEYSLMFSRPIPEFVPSATDLETTARRAFAPLQRAFADGIAAGALRPMDARTGATVAWALMHGLVSLELAHMEGPPLAVDLPPDATVPSQIAAIYGNALDLLDIALIAQR